MATSPVILVGSCGPYQVSGIHEAIRSTWGHQAAIPYFFILGDGCTARKSDEVVVPAGDSYDEIAYKMREGHRWARNQGYDYIFQAWADTYCFTRRMVKSRFDRFDYVGHFRGESVPQHEEVALGCYASGGSGYWTSPRFTDLIIAETPDHWAEDLWVGRVSKKFGIPGHQDYQYFSAGGYSNQALTIHLSRGTGNFNPVWLQQTYDHTIRKGGEL